MGRAGGAFQEAAHAAQLRLQLLRRQAVEARRAHGSLARADRVGGMVVNQRDELVRPRVAERQDGKLRVERPSRADRVVHRPDPVDRPILQQEPAVAADGFFLAEVEQELGVSRRRTLGVGFADRFHDRVFQPLHERLVAAVAVDDGGAWRVVGVGGGDEHAGRRDAGFRLDACQGAVDEVAGDEQDVAGDQRDLVRTAPLHHDGRRPELSLLAGRFPGSDAAGDNHRIIGLQRRGRRANAQRRLRIGAERRQRRNKRKEDAGKRGPHHTSPALFAAARPEVDHHHVVQDRPQHRRKVAPSKPRGKRVGVATDGRIGCSSHRMREPLRSSLTGAHR